MTPTKIAIVSFLSLAAFALLFAFLAVVHAKLSNPKLWYKLLHKTTQNKTFKELLDRRNPGEEFYKDVRTVGGMEYRTYISDHHFSNNPMISERPEGEKPNSKRTLLVRFQGMSGSYEIKDVHRDDFDDTIRMIYPRDPSNIDEFNRINAEAIIKLLELGYKPENMHFFGQCLGAEFITGALNIPELKAALGDQKFHSIVFQNAAADRSNILPVKIAHCVAKESCDFISKTTGDKVRSLPAQVIHIVHTKGDEIIAAKNSIAHAVARDNNLNSDKTIKVHLLDPKKCPKDFLKQTDLIFKLTKNHMIKLFPRKASDKSVVRDMLKDGKNFNSKDFDYIRTYDMNDQVAKDTLKQNLTPLSPFKKLTNTIFCKKNNAVTALI